MLFTAQQFAAIFPKVSAALQDRYRAAIEAATTEFDISTLVRAAAFLAQVGHETGGLLWLQELGGDAYFTKLYEGRADLGNTQPGDGALFHGRGLIQLTGRANYAEYGAKLGLDLVGNPTQAADIEAGARIAGCFWRDHGCNELADDDEFETITRRINGGLNGQPDRMNRWLFARQIFGLPVPEVL